MVEKNVKKGMSIREASDFWDEHEFGEFEDVEEVHDIQLREIWFGSYRREGRRSIRNEAG